MTIAKNIVQYRKALGYTQEQLGEKLGVSNQAVSKWESGVSSPDILLLPKLAKALGISLEQLYGMESPAHERIKADDFPEAANRKLTEYFKTQSHISFSDLQAPWCLLCLSDTAGGVYASSRFSFIDCGFKEPDGEKIFAMEEVASALRRLSNPLVRKVLAYMYRESFQREESCCQGFGISDIAKNCALSEEQALEGVEHLTALKMIAVFTENYTTEYIFLKNRAFFALGVFRIAMLLIQDGFSYQVLRDTSTINDVAFEKLW